MGEVDFNLQLKMKSFFIHVLINIPLRGYLDELEFWRG